MQINSDEQHTIFAQVLQSGTEVDGGDFGMFTASCNRSVVEII
jgi:hypothetical protein